jgi:hypothetical protein
MIGNAQKWQATRWIPSSTQTLCAVQIPVWKNGSGVGSSGDLTAYLYSDSGIAGGSPGAGPGTLLAQTGVILGSAVTSTTQAAALAAPTQFNFTTAQVANSGQTYWIVMSTSVVGTNVGGNIIAYAWPFNNSTGVYQYADPTGVAPFVENSTLHQLHFRPVTP